LLAVLKADVDRLGLVFGQGLGADRSPARVAQLSRLIDRFFSQVLPALLRARFPNTYTVYAGGDDLLLIGPWREGAGLALALREAFAAFAASNPNLTLSAGLAFIPAHMPLNRAVEEAEERLEAAKCAGRDRVGLLGAEVAWPQLAQADRHAEALSCHIRAGRVGSTQLHAILRLVRLRARAEAALAEPMAAMWNARWQYQRQRLAERLRETEGRDGLLTDLDALLPPPGQVPAVAAEIALTFALWRNR
jgi:CRISPR-associated protein Csm1